MSGRLLIVSLTAALLLTACGSSKPSERQARSAMVDMIEREMSSDVRQVKRFNLGNCRDAQGAPGVVCDVDAELEVETGVARQPAIPVPIQGAFRFSKVDGSWRASAR